MKQQMFSCPRISEMMQEKISLLGFDFAEDATLCSIQLAPDIGI